MPRAMPLCDRNAPMRNAPRYARAQMPRYTPKCPSVRPNAPRSRAGLPLYTRENAPIRPAGKQPACL